MSAHPSPTPRPSPSPKLTPNLTPSPDAEPDASPSALDIVALLAEPSRLKVFSAVVLGADTPAVVAGAAGVSARDAVAAVRRLRAGGLVTETGGRLVARGGHFGKSVRASRAAGESEPERHGYDDERVESLLRTFVRDGRLVRLPAQWARRRVVLQHLTHRTFAEDTAYDERAVNEKLRTWCEGAGTDHVTVRRYLVDLCLLGREGGRYWLRTDIQPAL
ncbi:DUF2087 domain-containing protein [Streptomyces yaizuensis]|uniref:DUF2087 domain-containing protein n=1 Tax=Streptomyces yaizuensis TaxID=2989713 RepID=A0ABQ5P9D6_9ACTN|nr:DUF2087 domain-containing protein [Streptomyces sp. YSPA8]GLF99167.1 DUF2087 domain-containing protein [Streptomyces sp. YSPA8]